MSLATEDAIEMFKVQRSAFIKFTQRQRQDESRCVDLASAVGRGCDAVTGLCALEEFKIERAEQS